MNIEELKQTIERQTGIPSRFLNGETVEETIAYAKALNAYKRDTDTTRPKSTAEQFAEWCNARDGITPTDATAEALERIEEQARVDAGGYPRVKDNDGSNVNMPDSRPARELFGEWWDKKTAVNPSEIF